MFLIFFTVFFTVAFFNSYIYGVDYIFTEFMFTFLNIYVNLNSHLESAFNVLLVWLSHSLPVLVRYSIGYCHFYYQLGYGLVFYIYIYRRRKAKKKSNWQTFYGNSILNWALFNTSIFNKFVFNRNFVSYLKAKLTKTISIFSFWFSSNFKKNTNAVKFFKLLSYYSNSINLQIWAPIFKRSSYISFLTLLKRFTKRK